jgi:hypothetical protein
MTTAAVPIALVERESSLERIEGGITVGKDVLELVTGAMYADPLCVFREYVQNAADAIDEARADSRLNGKAYEPKVEITIQRDGRTVAIRDNGAGVSNAEFVSRLTAIGGSKKRGTRFRGFRGVGRLSGLGYCQELVFRSRAFGDKWVFEVHWDGRRLREVLRDGSFAGGLGEAIREVAKIRKVQPKNEPPNFFEVQLRKVQRVKNDVLLNEDVVRGYLAQVAPVPFHPEFSPGQEIQAYLDRTNIGAPFNIELNDGKGRIYRPFLNDMPVSEKQADRLHTPKFFELPGLNEGVAAVGWIVQHSYFGAWSRKLGIGGLRVRLGNLQIGAADLLSPHFIEPRFNQWAVGEVHVISDRLVPNGRRDDFEHSSHYDNFIAQLAPRLSEITRLCREKSELRQKLKSANQYVQRARHALLALKSRTSSPIVRKVAEWQAKEALVGLERTLKSRALLADEKELVAAEVFRLSRDLERLTSRRGRDPLAGIPTRRRADAEALVQLVFEKLKNPKKAEQFARRLIQAFE